MFLFVLVLGALCAVAGLHSAYVAGLETGEARARESLRRQVLWAVRQECASPEVSQEQLSGSYRMVRRLVNEPRGEL